MINLVESLIILIIILFPVYVIFYSKPLPDLIITNIHKRYTGVTSTIINLFPEHAKTLNVGLYGNRINLGEKIVNFIDLLYYGYQLPEGKKCRIFHVRRNNEMILALIFRDILRLPIKIIFTQAKIKESSCFTNYLLKKMDHIIITCDKCKKFLIGINQNITISAHGINLSYFSSTQNNHKDIYNLKDKFIVSTFGRIREQKGTDIFVKALIKVMNNYPNVIGFVVGETDNEFFKENLNKLIKKDGSTDRFIFTGFVNDSAKHRYIYNSTDLCVTVPRQEQFGLTPIEAMACGIPVICSDTGAFYTMIDEDKTGNLIPIGDIDALVDKIEYYINNQNKLKEMSKYCIDKVNNNFIVEMEANRINEVYNKIWFH